MFVIAELAPFYREDTRMMSVSIDYEPRFRVGTPELVFDGLDGADRNYGIAADGQRSWLSNQSTLPRLQSN